MARSTYHIWFLATVSLALAGFTAFNAFADAYILRHPAGPSLQTVSGFERVIKPAWLASIAPNVVFVGSSRIRDGFDPVLIDKIFSVRSFNYGFSSVSAYETRRVVQDAAAQPSVKLIVLSLDAFSDEDSARRPGPGFDELRFAVTADGLPTPNRSLWLFATRYLSGGALGMHALGLYLLSQMQPGQTAADRPDIFEAYSRMTPATFRRDILYRRARSMRMPAWDRAEFLVALASVCHRDIHLIAFFPPDNAAIIARYEAQDRAGFLAFKATVLADVVRHNAVCRGKVSLFDFMRPNAITAAPLTDGGSPDYVDLVHFHPSVGVRLFRVMVDPAKAGADAALGHDLTR
ncbi:MAG: hypothetical protein ACXWLW_09490 [Rhizomicrobium sp.]